MNDLKAARERCEELRGSVSPHWKIWLVHSSQKQGESNHRPDTYGIMIENEDQGTDFTLDDWREATLHKVLQIIMDNRPREITAENLRPGRIVEENFSAVGPTLKVLQDIRGELVRIREALCPLPTSKT